MKKASWIVGSLLPFLLCAFSAEAEFRELTKKQCKKFMRTILEEDDEDLVVIPFVRRQLADIYKVLNGTRTHDAEFVAAILDDDGIRRAAYRLEALSKVMSEVDPVRYKALLGDFKALEKSVGDYVFQTEMVDLLHTDPALREFLTPEIEAYFKGRLTGYRDSMLASFRRQGWTDSLEAYGKVFAQIRDAKPITKMKELRELAAKRSAKRLRRIEKSIENGTLDPDEIENGVHELRRELRVFLLTTTVFDGVFHLDESYRVLPGPLPAEPAFKWLVPKEKDPIKHPIRLPKDGYLQIVQWIRDLGNLKAKDGAKEFIASAIRSGGLSKGANPLLMALTESSQAKKSFAKTRADSHSLFNEIVVSRVLPNMVKALERD